MNKHRTNKVSHSGYAHCSSPRIAALSSEINCLYWHGRSGRKYIHTVFSVTDWPGHSNANVLFVHRNFDDTREIIWAGQTGEIPGLTQDLGALARARRAGANEIHVHLLGEDEMMRQCIVEDLADDGRATNPGISSLREVGATQGPSDYFNLATPVLVVR